MHTQAELTALADKDYRHAYVDDHVRSMLAYQLRCIREKMGLTQKAFGKLIGKPASVVSRLENTDYGKVTVQTILDIADKLDVAVVVKFASFPEFLSSYKDLSPASLAVASYGESSSDNLIASASPATNIIVSEKLSQAEANLLQSAVIFNGVSNYNITRTVTIGGATAVFGVAVTPFAFLPVPVYGDRSHV